MWNARLDESQAGIRTARRNINNLRYADDTTLMKESEVELKSLLMRVKEESEKAGLKLNIKNKQTNLRSQHLVPSLREKQKDWCWSWSSNALATGCEKLTRQKRPWCWERLREGKEVDDRGWDGWIASLAQRTRIWANSGRQWRTRKPGVLHSQGRTETELTYQLNNNKFSNNL